MSGETGIRKYYEKGQKDGANGKYNPPHNKFGGGWLNNYSNKELDEIKAYKDGYRNANNNK